MKLEIVLALFSNLKVFIIILTVIFGLAAIISCLSAFSNYNVYDEKESLKALLKTYKVFPFIVCFLVGGLVACIPDIDDIWKIRIGLIKYELASPENVKQSTETIERLANKLECKYLGCEEKKK